MGRTPDMGDLSLSGIERKNLFGSEEQAGTKCPGKERTLVKRYANCRKGFESSSIF